MKDGWAEDGSTHRLWIAGSTVALVDHRAQDGGRVWLGWSFDLPIKTLERKTLLGAKRAIQRSAAAWLKQAAEAIEKMEVPQ